MELMEATAKCKQIIQENNNVIKESRKNGDINTMQLTAKLDEESIAIETILNQLEKKDLEIKLDNQAIDKRNVENLELVKNCIKKDKIIDKMASFIYLIESRWFNYCIFRSNGRECDERGCEKCIIECFKEEVENEKNEE